MESIKTYKIFGMTCGSCAMHIEKAMNELAGVQRAHVNFQTRELTLVSDKIIERSFLEKTLSTLGKYSLNENEHAKEKNQTSIWMWGFGGAVFITGILYFAQVLGMQSFQTPIAFMQDRWYFIFPLIVGFSIQVGIFRAIHFLTNRVGVEPIATSGSVSSGTMLACCMHNLVSLFPVLGISGLAVFFAVYQTQIFLMSIIVNFFGVWYMIYKYRSIKKMCAGH